MAALDFLRRKHNVTVAYFDHYTEHGMYAKLWLWRYCEKNQLRFVCGELQKPCPKGKSPEEHWREERYKYFDTLPGTIVTAHHLDDAVETWLWSSIHGQPKLPLTVRGNIVRPFLTTTKLELMDWCIRKNIPWVDDPSNMNQQYTRNYVRHSLMPVVAKINPGIQKTIKKKLLDREQITKYMTQENS